MKIVCKQYSSPRMIHFVECHSHFFFKKEPLKINKGYIYIVCVCVDIDYIYTQIQVVYTQTYTHIVRKEIRDRYIILTLKTPFLDRLT